MYKPFILFDEVKRMQDKKDHTGYNTYEDLEKQANKRMERYNKKGIKTILKQIDKLGLGYMICIENGKI